MKKAIFKFHYDCGRQGELEGLFISTKEKVKALIESEVEVYFGEVLGKHSEVYGRIDENEITYISDNPETVEIVEKEILSDLLEKISIQEQQFIVGDVEIIQGDKADVKEYKKKNY